MRKFAQGVALVLSLICAAIPVHAHGLLMKLRAEGARVAGEVYYSNGTKASGEWVEVRSLTDHEAAPQTLQTDAEGRFSAPGIQGHRYLLVATGEEGHSIEMEIMLAPGARGKLLENGVPVEPAGEEYPAWAIIGGLLLLSAWPALWLQRRRARKEAAR